MRGKAAAFFFLLFVSVSARAAELLGPDIGVVPFAMGRAYTAVADDWLALHYNPAGLALVDKGDFQAFDLKFGSNWDTITGSSSLRSVSGGTSGIANALNSMAGKNVRVEGANTTQVTLPNFAMGLIYNVHIDVDVQNTAYPYANVRHLRDLSVPIGFALSAGKQKNFRIGGKVAYVHRMGGETLLPISQIMSETGTVIDQVSHTGNGWSSTVGMQYRIPTGGRTEFTIAGVWHDIGKTSYGPYSSDARPMRTEDVVTAGLGLRFPIGGKQNRRLERRYGPKRSANHLTFAADYSHLNNSTDREVVVKHLHFGMNLDLPILSLQLGVNQTSLTYGTTFDLGIFRVALASYAEELGSYGGQRTDRRYLLSLGSSFSLGEFGRRRGR